MRNTAIILMLSLVMTLIVGCSGELPYEIVQEEGEYYLVFDVVENPDIEAGYVVKPAVGFASIREMKHDIETGNFTQDELNKIAQFPKDGEGRVQICDISGLYEAVYPSTYTVSNVTWTGTSYSFGIGCETWEVYDNFYTIPKVQFEHEVNFCANFDTETTLKNVSRTTVTDRNATVFSFSTVTGDEMKGIYYTITQGEKTLYIWEQYARRQYLACQQYQP